VVEVLRGTTIGVNGVKIYTTEHVLGALYGLQVDNCQIEMDGPEPPVMDGSSLPFAEALIEAGFEDQDEPKNYLVIDETIEYHDSENSVDIVALPLDNFRTTVMVDSKIPPSVHSTPGSSTLNRSSSRSLPPPAHSASSPKLKHLPARASSKAAMSTTQSSS